jgi:omega-hydroxy-beta-dihydromenaquinone-9 sulfotransferase
MNINKPIFILGSGRSGTTILYNLLSIHPDVCWFSEYSEKHPFSLTAPISMRLLEVPYIGDILKKRIIAGSSPSFLTPSEGQEIYHTYTGFRSDRKTTAKDRSLLSEDRFRSIILKHLRYTGKQRFLTKNTANTQRIQLLHALFPDAYWVHIIRDGRGVVNSLMHINWWPSVHLWWLGKTPGQWADSGGDMATLCARHWMHNVTEILHNKQLLSRRYMEIRYEDLVKNPKHIIEGITRFCKLTDDVSYLKFIPELLPDQNKKWHMELSRKQINSVEREAALLLHRLGYDE